MRSGVLGGRDREVESGADAVTLSPELLRAALSAPDIDHAVDDFIMDWKSVYGETRLPD